MMKKAISLMIVLTLLLSLCSCGQKQAAQNQPAETLDPQSPEAMFGHIDQNAPVNGVYQIWNAEGVRNIYNHLDGSFEFLCSVDMQGAVLAPIGSEEAPFTGKLVGDNFTISNFTVQGDGENFGVFGVNRGTVQNLLLDQVTLIPGENAKNIGSLAGTNEGTLLRCTLDHGTMTVDKAPEGANCGAIVGINAGNLTLLLRSKKICHIGKVECQQSGCCNVTRTGSLCAQFKLNAILIHTNDTHRKIGTVLKAEIRDIYILTVLPHPYRLCITVKELILVQLIEWS